MPTIQVTNADKFEKWQLSQVISNLQRYQAIWEIVFALSLLKDQNSKITLNKKQA